MKVWEAIDILRSLDPNAEVGITINGKVKTVPVAPLQPVYTPPPQWVQPPTYIPWWDKVTCETKQ